MARTIRHYVRTNGSDSEQAISADSTVIALTTFAEIMKELVKAYPDARAEVKFSELQIGSLVAVLEYEINTPDASSTEIAVQEREIETLYVGGWATLANGPNQPDGFTRRAVENVGRFVTLFASDGFADMQVSGALQAPITVTAHAIENVRQVLGASYTDLGATEGRLETISLANRPTFNVRDEVFGSVVTCSIGTLTLDQIKEALGRRVVVNGEVTYNKLGIPSEISPVFDLIIIDSDEIPLNRVIGIGAGLDGSDIPSEAYVKRAWDGN